jgi:hypothetical protein
LQPMQMEVSMYLATTGMFRNVLPPPRSEAEERRISNPWSAPI